MKQPQIARYESGERLPDPEILIKLAGVFGVSVHWLLTGEDVGATAGRAAHADQPLGYFATLARCLRETPLRPLVPDHTESFSARETEEQWRDLPEERRQEIIEVLHRAAAAALTIQATLPPTVAEKVNEFLGRQIDAYLAEAF